MPRRRTSGVPRLTWLRDKHLLLALVLLPSLVGLAGGIPGRVGSHRVEAASGIADAVQAIHVADAMSKPAGAFHPYNPGPPFFTNTVSVNYGGGRAVLAAKSDGSGGIFVDDVMEVAGPAGSRTIDFSQRCTVDLSSGGRQGPVDISALLQPGTNTVTFAFRDGCGINEGNSDIWLVMDTGPTVPQPAPPPPKVDFSNPPQPSSGQLQPSATPALRLSPAQGPAGTQVQANGMIQPNCGPTYQAFWDAQLTDVVTPSQPQPVQVATGPLNSDGTLDFTFKVPASVSPGDHIVGVLAPCTTIPGPYGIPSATFTVTTSASPNPGNPPSSGACKTTLKNEAGGCLKPNGDGRVLLLVAGIVPAKPIASGCSNDSCKTAERAKLLAGDAGNDVLKNALSAAGLTLENEVPFSYAGPDNPDSYTIDQNHQAIHDPSGKPNSVSALFDYVHRLKHDFGDSTRIDILAHSLGGVITAYAMLSDRQSKALIEQAVIVDSPVGGVNSASGLHTAIGSTLFANYFGITKNQGVYRDLQTGSDVVTALKSEESDPRLFVVTNWDDMLATVASALFRDTFAGTPRFWVRSLGITVTTLGHLEAFSSSDAARAIGGALGKKDPGFPADDQSDSTLLDAIGTCLNPLNVANPLGADANCTWHLGFGLFSPANILVTAPNGLREGWDPVSQAEVNEIPGAYYSGSGSEPQLIVIPKPVLGSYGVTVTGTGAGTYSLVEQENFGSNLSTADVRASTTPGEQTRVTANVDLTTPPALTFAAAGGSTGSDSAPAAIGISLAALAFGAVAVAMARRRRGVAPAGAAGRLVLVGPGGARIPLRGGRQVIGRDPGCDIVVQDSQVSRRHALLTVEARGAVVDDLSSSFGVFVNGARVTRCAVLPGDRLTLGSTQFVLADEGGR